MNSLVNYLIESSILMMLFYSLYYFLLRNQKTFNFNRFYLLGSTCLALMIPVLSLDFLTTQSNTLNQSLATIQDWQTSNLTITELGENPKYSLPVILFTSVFILGILSKLSRFILAFRNVWKLKKNHPIFMIGNTPVVQVSESIPPFSFLQYAFINTSIFNSDSFDQILAHEQVHIKQKHSYDLIFIELLACFYWFNPIIWMISRSIKESHEYIADQNIINYGYSSLAYQTLLLEQIVIRHSNKLMPHFNLSFIKKRITMMNTKKSKTLNFLKTGTVAFTALCLTFLSMNYHAFAKTKLSIQNNEFTIMLDTREINLKDGIDYSFIQSDDFKGYTTLSSKDKSPTPQTQLVYTLVGQVDGEVKVKGSVKVESIEDWKQVISLKDLLNNSAKGDILNIEIKGLYTQEEKAEKKARDERVISFMNIPIN